MKDKPVDLGAMVESMLLAPYKARDKMNQHAEDLFILETLRNWHRLAVVKTMKLPGTPIEEVRNQLEDNDRAIKMLEDRKK